MSKLHTRWPAQRIAPSDVFLALTLGRGQESTDVPACPACARSLSVYRVADQNAAWCSCDGCGWFGDHIEWFAAASNMEIPDALAALRLRGITVPTPCTHPKTMNDYLKYVTHREAAVRFDAVMTARKVRTHDSPALAFFGLTQCPHRAPLWWCAYTSEINASIGRYAPGSPEDSSCLVVPHRDAFGRVCGVNICTQPHAQTRPDWTYVGVVGASRGLGFVETAAFSCPAWGDLGVITSDANIAMLYHAAQSRVSLSNVPVVLIDLVADPRETPPLPAVHDWVLVHNEPVRVLHPSAFSYARRVGARMLAYHGQSVSRWPHNLADALVTAPPWTEVLEEAVLSRSDWGLAGFLVGLGWADSLERELAPVWKKSTMEKVRAALRKLHIEPRVPVARGLTIEITKSGWWWVERDTIVASCVPVLTEAYRDSVGKPRYRGHVYHGSTNYRFSFDVSAAKFRRDPFAVVDTTLMRHSSSLGVEQAPHPIIVPHAAALARYLLHRRTPES